MARRRLRRQRRPRPRAFGRGGDTRGPACNVLSGLRLVLSPRDRRPVDEPRVVEHDELLLRSTAPRGAQHHLLRVQRWRGLGPRLVVDRDDDLDRLGHTSRGAINLKRRCANEFVAPTKAVGDRERAAVDDGESSVFTSRAT